MFFWAIFCPFTPLATQNIEVLKKWKKRMKMSSFYICVPKIAIIWWMLLEIWVQHTFFCHFGSFFALLPTLLAPKVRNWKKKRDISFFTCAQQIKIPEILDVRPYDVRFLRYGVQQAKSFLILDHFLSFYWKIKILKKRESLESSSYPCVPQMTIIWCFMVP